MNNNQIPTAEEFLLQQDCIRNVEDFFNDVQPIDLKEFAKLHVKAALEAAAENAVLKEEEEGDEQVCYIENDMGLPFVLDKESILNAYPESNIK